MAKRFIHLLVEYIKTFKQFPDAGQNVFPDKYKNLKQRLYKSYRIIYEVVDDEINIVTIHHQSRLLENINSLKDYEIPK
jgi:plasmid stabilization system protein ParE